MRTAEAPPRSRLRSPRRERAVGLGPYVLDRPLAAPGPIEVWAGHRRRARRGEASTVAVKWCARHDAASVASLQREAAALAACRHRHVVPLLDVARGARRLGVVVPFAVHGTLDDQLRAGPLDASTSARLGAALAGALAAVHAAGLVHGDVKPSNVLFVEPGAPLLADFGISGPPGSARSDGGVVSGTAEYLDPDVVDGAPRDASSDVYALGVLLYVALRGEAPYRAPTALATARLADGGNAPSLAAFGVPEPLATIVHRAMARCRADRFADAAALHEALAVCAATATPGRDRAVAGRPAGAPADSGTRVFGPRPPVTAASSTTRRRWSVLGATCAVVAAVVAVIVAVAGPGLRGATGCHGSRRARPVGAAVIAADVDGDGCVDELVWASPRLEVRATRRGTDARTFALGGAVDVVVLAGDWWCRGIDLLGWYEPRTGTVRLFTSWGVGQVGEALPSPVTRHGRAGARPVVQRGDHRHTCDVVTFER